MQHGFASPDIAMSVAQFHHASIDPRGLRVTKTTYFSLLTHVKQLLLMTFFNTTAGIGKNGNVREGRTDRQTGNLK